MWGCGCRWACRRGVAAQALPTSTVVTAVALRDLAVEIAAKIRGRHPPARPRSSFSHYIMLLISPLPPRSSSRDASCSATTASAACSRHVAHRGAGGDAQPGGRRLRDARSTRRPSSTRAASGSWIRACASPTSSRAGAGGGRRLARRVQWVLADPTATLSTARSARWRAGGRRHAQPRRRRERGLPPFLFTVGDGGRCAASRTACAACGRAACGASCCR